MFPFYISQAQNMQVLEYMSWEVAGSMSYTQQLPDSQIKINTDKANHTMNHLSVIYFNATDPLE